MLIFGNLFTIRASYESMRKVHLFNQNVTLKGKGFDPNFVEYTHLQENVNMGAEPDSCCYT